MKYPLIELDHNVDTAIRHLDSALDVLWRNLPQDDVSVQETKRLLGQATAQVKQALYPLHNQIVEEKVAFNKEFRQAVK